VCARGGLFVGPRKKMRPGCQSVINSSSHGEPLINSNGGFLYSHLIKGGPESVFVEKIYGRSVK
jgi:hypothetical protein